MMFSPLKERSEISSVYIYAVCKYVHALTRACACNHTYVCVDEYIHICYVYTHIYIHTCIERENV
jgi:hypothetical protein